MKQIRLLLIGVISLFCALPIVGQQTVVNADSLLIHLQVLPPRGLEKQQNVADILQNRLKQAVVLNGAVAESSPFVLETVIQTLSGQATPSTPPQFVVELEITCSITDRVKRVTLQQTTFHIKGVAQTRMKAVMNAITSIQARHPQLKTLIRKGKEKISSGYETENNL